MKQVYYIVYNLTQDKYLKFNLQLGGGGYPYWETRLSEADVFMVVYNKSRSKVQTSTNPHRESHKSDTDPRYLHTFILSFPNHKTDDVDYVVDILEKTYKLVGIRGSDAIHIVPFGLDEMYPYFNMMVEI